MANIDVAFTESRGESLPGGDQDPDGVVSSQPHIQIVDINQTTNLPSFRMQIEQRLDQLQVPMIPLLHILFLNLEILFHYMSNLAHLQAQLRASNPTLNNFHVPGRWFPNIFKMFKIEMAHMIFVVKYIHLTLVFAAAHSCDVW